MDAGNFTQGMSDASALNAGTSLSKLSNPDRWNFMKSGNRTHWKRLSSRPDWDGIVTIDEGVAWAKSHPNLRANPDDTNYLNATADDYLYLDASKMDFGSLSVSDLRYNVEQGVNLLDHVNLLSNRSRFTTYALGRSKMTLKSTSGKVQISNGAWNAYDWDYGGNAVREGLIFGERTLKGLNNTHGFPISVYGIGRLNKK